MKQSPASRPGPFIGSFLLWLFAAVVIVCFFAGFSVPLTLLAGLATVWMLLYTDLTPLRTPSALLLLGYVCVSGFTIFWALSGKFFLQEYTKLFTACVLFLAVVLYPKFSTRTAHQILALISGVSAIYAVLSVEAASTRCTEILLKTALPSMSTLFMGFEAGTRLTGIFGNANLLSSLLALGILFSVHLLGQASDRPSQTLYAGLLALNAFAFLLCFSMGGIACFTLAVFIYLFFAGSQRGGALVRMLLCALPALLFAFVSFPFFPTDDTSNPIPLLIMAFHTAAVLILEETLAQRLTVWVESRKKVAFYGSIGVFILAVLYLILGYHLSGPYTFEGDSLRRSAYPIPGTHTLKTESTQEVQLTITSQNPSEILMHTQTVLYQGNATDAIFTVPEDSKVCYFHFSAPKGTVLNTAQLDPGETLRLNYLLLPGFIANRIQGLWANQNALQRTVFFQDGIKLFLLRPLLGNGVGSFETGLTRVQDFYYETKYIHNHYIQILLESGLVGFLFYVSALVLLLWALWRKQKEASEPLHVIAPALWSAMTMLLAHSAVEVSLSICVVLFPAFLVFGLVVRTCTTPIACGGKKVRFIWGNRVLYLLLPAIFTLSLSGNLAAQRIRKQPVSSMEEYADRTSLAVALDLYEKNDAKLSLVMSSLNAPQELGPQAERYAKELLSVSSNTIPLYLTQYYLAIQQYDLALQAAQLGATCSASHHGVWNQLALLLGSVLLSPENSPLLADPTLVEDVIELEQMLQRRNETSMEEIHLETEAADVFYIIASIAASDRTPESIRDILSQHANQSR